MSDQKAHPIENLMITAMNSIQDMIDVNTIIGEPIETTNNILIIPISKVGFGFAAGGSEFKGETIDEYTKKEKEEAIQYRLPFGGGSGAGVSVSPVAFLVIQPNNVKLLPVEHCSSVDKLLDYVPDLIEKMNNFLNKSMQNKKEEKKEIERKKEKTRREIQEAIKSANEDIEDQTQNVIQKTRPKRSKIPRTDPMMYEYEYDETNQDIDDENYDE